jgi:RimJ/RimL family protein N-acetyltransferase
MHTERLILRTPQVRDASIYVHINNNPLNSTYDPSPIDPSKAPEAPEKYQQKIPVWREDTAKGVAALMVITLPGDGSDGPEGQGINRETLMKDGEMMKDVVIGQTGFNELKWKTAPDGKVCEKQDGSEGILVADILDAPNYVRKGYAKEAMVAPINYGFDACGVEALLCW